MPILISSAVIYLVWFRKRLGIGDELGMTVNADELTFLTTPNVLSSERNVACQKVRNTEHQEK
jgi:hypothetical protein